ncbi:MAG: aromatic aminobenezylarsenical efflux permease ArsG family transporter [Kosmotogaceae bacterium]
MDNVFLAILSALWFGILTSISPCPLTTNIAAVSFISRNIKSPVKSITSGILYTIGRMFTYVIIGSIIVSSLTLAPRISIFLQKYMGKLIGPIMIIVGLFLLELLSFNIRGKNIDAEKQERIKKQGLFGALFLGSLFALSFCPISAALFFGSVIPLAVEEQSRILIPAIYGIGTGIPVLLVAITLAFSTKLVAKMFKRINQFEYWARTITGSFFIALGIYFSITRIYL